MEPHEIPAIVRLIQEEVGPALDKIIQACKALVRDKFIPLRQNSRTNFVMHQVVRDILIENKLTTAEDFDALYKKHDDALKINEVKAEEKAKELKEKAKLRKTLTIH